MSPRIAHPKRLATPAHGQNSTTVDNIGMAMWGGTLCMGSDPNDPGHIKVYYDHRHLYAAAGLSKLPEGDKNQKRLLEELVALKLDDGIRPRKVVDHELNKIVDEVRSLTAKPDAGYVRKVTWKPTGKERGLPKIDTTTGELTRGPIDSIDYCFASAADNFGASRPEVVCDHFEAMLQQARQYFTETKGIKPQTFLACGGTDALNMYGLMLTMALKQEGFLQPGSGQRVVFVTSMKSFEEAPLQNAKIFRAAKSLARKMGEGYEGGYVLSPQNNKVSSLAIHDITNGFTKFSGNLNNSFASVQQVGTLSENEGLFSFKANPYYVPPVIPAYSAASGAPYRTQLGRVAPALIQGNSFTGQVVYLQRILEDDPPKVDAVVFEGLPSYAQPKELQLMQTLVREATQKGIACVFVNSHTYQPYPTPSFKRAVEKSAWDKRWELEKAGAVMLDGMTLNHAIIHTMMHTGRTRDLGLIGPEKIGAAFENYNLATVKKFTPPMDSAAKTAAIDELIESNKIIGRDPRGGTCIERKLPAIGLWYFPDYDMLQYGLQAAAPISREIVISALPSGGMAGVFQNVLHQAKIENPGLRIGVGYRWAGLQHDLGGGRRVVEKVENDIHYAAGIACLRKADFTCGEVSPQQYVASANRQEKPSKVDRAATVGSSPLR